MVSLSTLGYFWYWLRGLSSGSSYRATIEVVNAGGMEVGTAVAYWGVPVGRVVAVRPNPNGVDIEIEIRPSSLKIPRDSRIAANQSGLIGETAIDITPRQELSDVSLESVAPPLDPNCDSTLIICDGARLAGEAQLDVNALIRSVQRIANILGSPEVASNLDAISRNAVLALDDIAKLGDEVEGLFAERPLDEPLEAIATTAASIERFLSELEGPLASSFESLDGATERIANAIDRDNKALAATLASLADTSSTIGEVVAELTPALTQLNQSEIVENFDALSVDAAAAAENVLSFSDRLGDPENIRKLQEVLDSAREAFEGTVKVTADTDDLTGDPKFRNDVLQLIESLEKLLSSTQQLERQLAQARIQQSLAIAQSKP
ncbi:MAG: MlaD family protein [Cyanobacteria bacterium J06641_5]